MNSPSRRRQAPRHISFPPAQFNNVALVPASELANLNAWQERAQHLPQGELLVVVPQGNAHLHEVGKRICRARLERDQHSTLVSIRGD